MIKNIIYSLLIYLICLLLISFYSLTIYSVSHKFMPSQAKGSLIYDQQEQIRGSMLLSQRLNEQLFFSSRLQHKFDEACDLALYNDKLKNNLKSHFAAGTNHYDISLLTPSASLLDPYIMKRDAIRQAINIARQRKIKLEELLMLIENNYLANDSIFFELDIINTNLLNKALLTYQAN